MRSTACTGRDATGTHAHTPADTYNHHIATHTYSFPFVPLQFKFFLHSKINGIL